jgi:signal transduction histidine kinase
METSGRPVASPAPSGPSGPSVDPVPPTGGRIVAGVAADLARALGLDPVVVRISFVVLSLAGGTGVLLYGLLWLRGVEDPGRPAARLAALRAETAGGPATPAEQTGLALAAAGVLLALRAAGLWFGDGLVLPVLFGGVGSALVWSRADAGDRARLTRRLPVPAALTAALRRNGSDLPAPTVSPLRLVGGTALVALAMLALLAANDALGALRDLGVALLAAAIGLGLLFGPWALRLVEQAGEERRARIREEERGDLAAHLHDSVLQTLALIQRAAGDPQRMAALARRQERELRRWLFEGRVGPDAATLSGSLTAAVTALEEATGVEIQLVRVGDAPMDAALTALVAALREAVMNIGAHAGTGEADVYVEVTDDAITVFVRDRGPGFDPSEVAEDRSGIRLSIRGRLERVGGTAVLRTAPGEGCEWELRLPRTQDDA